MCEAVNVPSFMMMTSIAFEESLARGTHTHTHTHTRARTHTRTHTHTYTHTHTHTHTYTHIHTGLVYVNLFRKS